jgi:uncharacterized SAM-binding protein YcdF (DUF218 family)
LSPKRPTRRVTRRKRPNWRRRGIIAALGLVLGLIAWAAIERRLAPTSNTSLTRFDVIIVLGTSADADGNPEPRQLARVTEAVQEYERGIAPRILFTGAAVKNQFVEAKVMARSAHALGIPDSAILIEPQARNTIENACYAVRMMQAHDWHSAEVISGEDHLPRAALIFSHLPIQFATHVAPSLSPKSLAHDSYDNTVETLKTVRYLVWARWADSCQP